MLKEQTRDTVNILNGNKLYTLHHITLEFANSFHGQICISNYKTSEGGQNFMDNHQHRAGVFAFMFLIFW